MFLTLGISFLFALFFFQPHGHFSYHRTQAETTEQVAVQSTIPNDTSASSRAWSRKVSSITVPQPTGIQPVVIQPGSIPPSFAPGFSPTSSTPPITPLTRPDNKARQRRVSSVSSSHSIRQVGTYGGNMSPTKMISPARKANPYYSGVLARFSNNGTRHSLHERELSASGKRRSVVNAERAKVGVEGNNSSREKLDLAYKELQESAIASEKAQRPRSVASTTNSVVSEAKEQESPSTLHASVMEAEDSASTGQSTAKLVESVSRELSTPIPAPPLMFSATYEEEYDVEKDESARNSVQSSPFITKSGIEASPLHNGRALFNARPTTPVMAKSVINPPIIDSASTPSSQVRDRATVSCLHKRLAPSEHTPAVSLSIARESYLTFFVNRMMAVKIVANLSRVTRLLYHRATPLGLSPAASQPIMGRYQVAIPALSGQTPLTRVSCPPLNLKSPIQKLRLQYQLSRLATIELKGSLQRRRGMFQSLSTT